MKGQEEKVVLSNLPISARKMFSAAKKYLTPPVWKPMELLRTSKLKHRTIEDCHAKSWDVYEILGKMRILDLIVLPHWNLDASPNLFFPVMHWVITLQFQIASGIISGFKTSQPSPPNLNSNY